MNTATGLISGTPTAAGTSTVTLSATNGGGTGNATLTLTIAVARTGDHQRDHGQRDGGHGLLLSDHGDATRRPVTAPRDCRRAVGEHLHGIDLGDTDGGGNLHGDAERDQRRRHRARHSDADHHGGGAGDHQRDDGQRDGGHGLLLSDHGDQLADQLRSHGLAGGLVGEHLYGLDLGDTDSGGNLHGDAERDQWRGHRKRHSDADHHAWRPGNHQRDDGERDSGNRILLSDHRDELADQLWSDGLAGGLSVNTSSGLISGTPTAAGTSTVTLSATNGSGTGHATLTLTIGSVVTISSAQIVATAAAGSASSLSLSFPQNTVAGDLIVVAFDYDTSNTPASVTDSQGNVFTTVGNQLTTPGGARSRVYYAKNIKGGADTVTVTLSGSSSWLELYLSEYTGADQTNPIDGQAGASGAAGAVSSGNGTTTAGGDIIFGYCVADYACTAGTGFTTRSNFNHNLIEDELGGAAGTYAATGSANNGWTMQMVALKARTN